MHNLQHISHSMNRLFTLILFFITVVNASTCGNGFASTNEQAQTVLFNSDYASACTLFSQPFGLVTSEALSYTLEGDYSHNGTHVVLMGVPVSTPTVTVDVFFVKSTSSPFGSFSVSYALSAAAGCELGNLTAFTFSSPAITSCGPVTCEFANSGEGAMCYVMEAMAQIPLTGFTNGSTTGKFVIFADGESTGIYAIDINNISVAIDSGDAADYCDLPTVSLTNATCSSGGGGAPDNDLRPGEIAGIVIGAFTGLLLLFIIVAMCASGPPASSNKYVKL